MPTVMTFMKDVEGSSYDVF